jgi:hypothetical protein
VNQPAGGIGGEHSQRPQNQQKYTDCPKHLFAPSRYVNASAGPKAPTERNGVCGPADPGISLCAECRICTGRGSCCRSKVPQQYGYPPKCHLRDCPGLAKWRPGGRSALNSMPRRMALAVQTSPRSHQCPCAGSVKPRQQVEFA